MKRDTFAMEVSRQTQRLLRETRSASRELINPSRGTRGEVIVRIKVDLIFDSGVRNMRSEAPYLKYNCSLISGRRTTHNPFTSRNKPWDPYGIAKFDLSGLLLGHKYLYLRSPIHCCPLPDTRSGLEKPEGPILGQPGNVDAPGMVLVTDI